MTMHTAATPLDRPGGRGSLGRVFGSVLALAAVAGAAPAVLAAIAHSRFDSPVPWSGLGWLTTTEPGRLVEAATTDGVVTDTVVALALVVGWLAIASVAVSIPSEVRHLRRRGVVTAPRRRGLHWTRSIAAYIAAGLVAAAPLTTAGANDVSAALPAVGVSVTLTDHTVRPSPSAVSGVRTHVVGPGESVLAIAERYHGGDPIDVANYAAAMVDLNLGKSMPGGERFTNPALVEPGWPLVLPDAPAAPSSPGSEVVHDVRPGDTLWDLASEHLGDGTRWPEVWEHNAGQVMNDGGVFDDPHLIRVGWELTVPTAIATVDPFEGDHGPVDAVPDAALAPVADGDPETDAVAVADTADDSDAIIEPDVVADAPVVIEWSGEQTAPPEPAPSDEFVPHEVVPGAVMSGDDAPSITHDVTGPDASRAEIPAGALRSAVGWGGAMLAASVLALVTAQRRRRLRAATPELRSPEPPPRQVELERSLQQVAAAEPLTRLDLVLRAAANQIADHHSWVVGAVVSPDGAVELVLGDVGVLAAPFVGEGNRWMLPAEVTMSRLAACSQGAAMPAPAVVEIGSDEQGRTVFLDLDSVDVLRIGAAAPSVDDDLAGPEIVRALAASIATSVFARDVDVIDAGVGPVPEIFGRTIDATDGRPTPLRAAGLDHDDRATRFANGVRDPGSVDRTLAFGVDGVVGCVRSVDGGSDPVAARLGPDDGSWVLDVPVLRGRDAAETDRWRVSLRPVGLPVALAAELRDLVSADADLTSPSETDDGRRSAHTTDGGTTDRADPIGDRAHREGVVRDVIEDVIEPSLVDASVPSPDEISDREPNDREPSDRVLVDNEHAVLVRMIGPVDVVDQAGRPVPFRRGKSRELIVWLAAHRSCPTRTGARTALWESDVRDATFANVLSEARRALSAAAGHDEDGWLRRGDGDQLVLHPGVVSDLDLVLDAIAATKGGTPTDVVDRLGPLLGLVRGAPFHGTSYLWSDVEGITTRAVLAATSFATLLAQAHLSLGDLDGVFEATGAGLAALPGHEGLIALRLRAHAQLGDRASMREEWCAYERALANDPWFDGEPAPALVALRRELLVATPV